MVCHLELYGFQSKVSGILSFSRRHAPLFPIQTYFLPLFIFPSAVTWCLLQKAPCLRAWGKKCVSFVHFLFCCYFQVRALRVLTDKVFLSSMFQNTFITHWLSIVSVSETSHMKFHFWFHPFILHLLHQGLISLAPCFEISCTMFLKWNIESKNET